MLGFGSGFPVEILGFIDGVFGGFQATEWALALHLFHSTDTMDLDPWLGKSQVRMVRFCIYQYIHLVGGFKHFLFCHILGIMIPTDFHIFQRGRYTTNQIYFMVRYDIMGRYGDITQQLYLDLGICMGTLSYGHRMGTDMSKNSGETEGMGVLLSS